tara:strand:- start:275 stop:448 length:174 start_codon:yes stop_codon:yes gene_type:complete
MAKKDKEVVVEEEVVEEEVIIEEPVPEPTPEPKPEYKIIQTARGLMRRYADGTMGPH